MLSSAHIVNLEARWKRWKIKRYFKLFTIVVMLFSFSILSWYGYTLLDKPNIFSEKKMPIASPAEKEISMEVEQKRILSADSTVSSSLKETILKQPELSIQTLPPSKKSFTSKKNIAIPKTETIALKPLYEKEDATDVLADKKSTINEKGTNQSDSLSLAPKKAAKIHIDIQPASSNTTKYLKEKFDATGNVVFALMIADEYYSLEEYENALRWALTANEMNPKNERSWILFAMTKAKLNRPQEGILALEEYLKTNNSGKIESLLINLRRGTF